ncbi:MAG: Stp1/IreP family PP2C-type Ser/Thr phosphatase [Deltaproteobacteria bacterium]|nr:Stp1/IreP family PP2C-type Ser/Thr phosphatase [Deltaproteobacteria bacterium]
MDFKSFGFSDAGKLRSHNEDRYLCNAEHKLFLVADGMGGQASGETASQLAVREMEDFVIRSRSQGERWPRKARHDLTLEQHRLLAAVTLANRRIYEAAGASPEMKGMGTTLVGAILEGDHLAVVNVGDSRLYRVRDGEILQLTVDHSFVEERVRKGDLTREEARGHEKKHILTRALGVQEKVKADLSLVDLKSGDLVLLCSDGLYRMLEDSRILSVMESVMDRSLYKIGLSLVLQANLAGGLDNITVVLIALS